ncbi:unnamed protein product [Caenorhabditis brenneri]
MTGFFLTPDEYDNPNPSKGYNLFADAYYKKLVLKTRNEKKGQARKAWEELSNFQRSSFDHKAAELRKLYRETHPTPKRLQSPYILFFTRESKKIRNTEGKQVCPVLAKRLSAAWKQMSDVEKNPFVEEARRLKEAHDNDLKNQIKIKNPSEFTNWTNIETTFNAGEEFPWTKILGPGGLATMEHN